MLVSLKCPPQKSDCTDVPAIQPIVQNSVNGMRVCGKRSTGVAFVDAKRRPVKSSNGGYACPSGYKACNEEWLSSTTDREFVTCISSEKSLEGECPITSFALTLEGMDSETAALYSKAAQHEESTGTLYYSKKVANHPIYDV